jgi:hypothetical protein
MWLIEARKAETLKILLANADRSKGGRTHAALCADPQYVLECAISRMREEARKRGEMLPSFYNIVPLDAPERIKDPGRKARQRRGRAARASSQVPPNEK